MPPFGGAENPERSVQGPNHRSDRSQRTTYLAVIHSQRNGSKVSAFTEREDGMGLEWTHTANGLAVHFAQGLIVEIGLLIGGFIIYWNTRQRTVSCLRRKKD